MKKQSLITLCVLTAGILLAGCGAGTGTTSDMETIGKAMEAGTAMKCVVTTADESLPAAEIVYYVDGKNVRVESSFNGQSMIAILKDDVSYMQPMMQAGDCDWITMEDGEEDEQMGDADFDYEKYEADPMYEMICDFGSVDASNFEISGKVCTTEEMMQEMMGGIDLGGIDLEGIDMGGF